MVGTFKGTKPSRDHLWHIYDVALFLRLCVCRPVTHLTEVFAEVSFYLFFYQQTNMRAGSILAHVYTHTHRVRKQHIVEKLLYQQDTISSSKLRSPLHCSGG